MRSGYRSAMLQESEKEGWGAGVEVGGNGWALDTCPCSQLRYWRGEIRKNVLIGGEAA